MSSTEDQLRAATTELANIIRKVADYNEKMNAYDREVLSRNAEWGRLVREYQILKDYPSRFGHGQWSAALDNAHVRIVKVREESWQLQSVAEIWERAIKQLCDAKELLQADVLRLQAQLLAEQQAAESEKRKKEEQRRKLDEHQQWWREQYAQYETKQQAAENEKRKKEDQRRKLDEHQRWWREQYAQYEAKQAKPKKKAQKPPKPTPSATPVFNMATFHKDVLDWRRATETAFASYSAMTAFPDPPVKPCVKLSCVATVKERALEACDCSMRAAFQVLAMTARVNPKKERFRWHPDKFSACTSDKKVEFQKKAKEVFVVLNGI